MDLPLIMSKNELYWGAPEAAVAVLLGLKKVNAPLTSSSNVAGASLRAIRWGFVEGERSASGAACTATTAMQITSSVIDPMNRIVEVIVSLCGWI